MMMMRSDCDNGCINDDDNIPNFIYQYEKQREIIIKVTGIVSWRRKTIVYTVATIILPYSSIFLEKKELLMYKCNAM